MSRLDEIRERAEKQPQLIEFHAREDIPYLLSEVERLREESAGTLDLLDGNDVEFEKMLNRAEESEAEVERLRYLFAQIKASSTITRAWLIANKALEGDNEPRKV